MVARVHDFRINGTTQDGKGASGANRRRKGRRWLAPWKDSVVRPVIYHCVTRVVDRRFAFEQADKEKFRTLMRMQENFTGCKVLAYCLMSNQLQAAA